MSAAPTTTRMTPNVATGLQPAHDDQGHATLRCAWPAVDQELGEHPGADDHGRRAAVPWGRACISPSSRFGTTITGHRARWATAAETDPSTAERHVPRPRLPTTRNSASQSAAAAASSAAGWPRRSSQSAWAGVMSGARRSKASRASAPSQLGRALMSTVRAAGDDALSSRSTAWRRPGRRRATWPGLRRRWRAVRERLGARRAASIRRARHVRPRARRHGQAATSPSARQVDSVPRAGLCADPRGSSPASPARADRANLYAQVREALRSAPR